MLNANRFRRLMALCLALLLCSGCGAKTPPAEPSASDWTEDDPFSQAPADEFTGTISHGLDQTRADSRQFEYAGEPIEIPYEVEADGVAVNAGFLIFLDGVPQPYRLDRSDSEYAYLHRPEITDGHAAFSFLFEPVTGSKGDTADVYILSVTSRSGSSQEGLMFGTSQGFLPFKLSIHFSADAAPVDYGMDSSNTVLGKPLLSTEKLTLDSIQEYTGNSMLGGTETDLNTTVCNRVFVDGQDTLLQATFPVAGQERAQIRNVLLGHPGVQYRTIFFLDFQPLWYDSQIAFNSSLENGNAAVWEAELDTSALKGNHVLWVISVPCNSMDFPDDDVDIHICSVVLEGAGPA